MNRYLPTLGGNLVPHGLGLYVEFKDAEKIESENAALRASLAEMTELVESYLESYSDLWGERRQSEQDYMKGEISQARALLEGTK